MILVKIDVTKIDKARLFKGAKGTYLDLVLKETPDGKYGNDYMVTQSVSQEERASGVKGEILGNGKIVGRRSDPKAERPAQESQQEDSDSVPF